MTQNFIHLTIDGGAASGKSSTARQLARELNFLHIDTGSHYRALTCACLQAGILPDDGDELDPFLRTLRLETRIEGMAGMIILNGIEYTGEELKSKAVNEYVSPFAALPLLREALKAYQKAQGEVARQAGFAGVVMEGRDIGTVIFPQAEVKIYLQADAGTRQARRQLEGLDDTIAARDKIDSSRKTAPLQAAEDAYRLDNSRLSLEEVVAEIVDLVRSRQNLPANMS